MKKFKKVNQKIFYLKLHFFGGKKRSFNKVGAVEKIYF